VWPWGSLSRIFSLALSVLRGFLHFVMTDPTAPDQRPSVALSRSTMILSG